MREIKFRAWHKKYKWFGQVVWLDIPHNNTENPKLGVVTKDIPPDGWDADEFELKEAILMQYTGLKDENGVEIYEGDIVKLTLETDLQDDTCKVMFGRGYFGVTADDFEYEPLFLHAGTCKVVGNIYANPELLDPTPQKGKDNE